MNQRELSLALRLRRRAFEQHEAAFEQLNSFCGVADARWHQEAYY